jgi:hypothetical protein
MLTCDIQAETYKSFVHEWRQLRLKVRPPVSAKASKKASKKLCPYPAFPAEGLDQKAASALCPPGGSIWRGTSDGRWQCHYPPYKRKSFPWSVYGFDGAAKMCLQHLWTLYLEDQGQAVCACPVPGLFSTSQSSAASSSKG